MAKREEGYEVSAGGRREWTEENVESVVRNWLHKYKTISFYDAAREFLQACAERDHYKFEYQRLKKAIIEMTHEIEQTLGKALDYPPLYPHVSNVDDGQVCVGEHIPETLAEEAAERIAKLQHELEALKGKSVNGD